MKTGFAHGFTLILQKFQSASGGARQACTPVIANYHTQNLALASESIDTCPESFRDISGLILGLSAESAEEVKKEIRKFRKKLMSIAAREKSPDRVYNVNFQIIPLRWKPDVIKWL